MCINTTHMTVAEVNQGCIVVGLEQLEVEELPVKEEPRRTAVPRDGGTHRVVDEYGVVHTAHEQSRQLDPP